MHRLLSFVLLTSTLVVFVCWSMELAEVCGASCFPNLRRHAAQLDHLLKQRDAFLPRLTAVLDEVALGRLSMSSACARVRREAMETHPAFLEQVDVLIVGTDLETKLARYVLHQFEIGLTRESASPYAKERYERLARECGQIAAHVTAVP